MLHAPGAGGTGTGPVQTDRMGTGLGGPHDLRRVARPGPFLPDPTKAGCGCLLATLLPILVVILVVSNL